MNLWRRKLLAFLHDPPHKPFRIAGHEDDVKLPDAEPLCFFPRHREEFRLGGRFFCHDTGTAAYMQQALSSSW